MLPRYVLLNSEVVVKKLKENEMDLDIFIEELFKADDMISVYFKDDYNMDKFRLKLKVGMNAILLHIKSLFIIAKILDVEPESIVYNELDKIRYELLESKLEGCKKILSLYKYDNKNLFSTFAEGEEDTIMRIWNNELLQFTVCFREKEVIDNIDNNEIYEDLYNIISNNFIVLENELQPTYSIKDGYIKYKCYIELEDFDFMSITNIIDDALENLLKNKYNKSNEEISNILLKGYESDEEDTFYIID